MKGEGIFSAENPHSSYTQFRAWTDCRFNHYLRYAKGLEQSSKFFQDGRATHEVLETINRLAMAAKQDISIIEEVNPIIEKAAKGFTSFEWFQQIAPKIRIFGEGVNHDRKFIKAVEEEVRLPMKIKFPGVGVRDMYLLGQVDRRDTNENGDLVINEYKQVGRIPSEDELESDTQTGLYNGIYRFGEYKDSMGLWVTLRFVGTGWRQWKSIFHNITIGPVKADEANANDAVAFAKSKSEEMAYAIAAEEWEPTVCRNCIGCPGAADCPAWISERESLGIDSMVPTLANYATLRARAGALEAAKKNLKPHIEKRVEEAPGCVLEEGGWRAEIKGYGGKLSDESKRMMGKFDEAIKGGAEMLAAFRQELEMWLTSNPMQKLNLKESGFPEAPSKKAAGKPAKKKGKK